MKYVLPFALFATPALAHPGAHLHPHGVEGWTVALGLAVVVAAGLLVLRGRS